MSFYFNADEVFQIGVQIEVNGKAFYDAAAERASEPSVKTLCRELAAWEGQHIELFENLRRGLPAEAREGAAFDPASEEASYIRAAADTHVFLKNRDLAPLVSACRTGADLLDLALTFEKDSVVFYTTLKPLVAKHQAQERLDTLIREEIRHIAILTKEKAKLGG
jgi:rubrerythrin